MTALRLLRVAARGTLRALRRASSYPGLILCVLLEWVDPMPDDSDQ